MCAAYFEDGDSGVMVRLAGGQFADTPEQFLGK